MLQTIYNFNMIEKRGKQKENYPTHIKTNDFYKHYSKLFFKKYKTENSKRFS